MKAKIYLYHQKHRVVLVDTSSGCYNKREYKQVYTQNLKAHRGTDNRILIEFVNQDQKPTKLDGLNFIFRIISEEGTEILFEKQLEIVNKRNGQGRVVITEQELDKIPPGIKYFSIERHYFPYTPIVIAPEVAVLGYPPTSDCNVNSNTGPADPVNPEDFEEVLYEPTYVDDNAGGRGNIEILDSIMPSFVPSNTLTIPAISGLNNEYNSSIINTDNQSMHTFQLGVDNFNGTITFQGASDTDDQWYDIVNATYSNYTNPIGINVSGYHPYMRINIKDNTSGSITNIIYR